MNAHNLLELQGITAGYGNKTIITDVNMSVGNGQIVTLLGSNGVGKTTTLKTITGQIRPSSGRLFYDRKEIRGLSPYKIADLGMGYSPEGRHVFGNLTVYENLVVGAYRLKTKTEFLANLAWVYSLFPRLKERNEQMAELLSGGEQQMLSIGRALISKPVLLLLDEPSLGLAPMLVKIIADTLVEINTKGVSILLVEQNAKLALETSHYAFVMEKGTVNFEGESQELRQEKHIANIYLGFD
jgi:branched-chain amino acid transport system ATP-binding protein